MKKQISFQTSSPETNSPLKEYIYLSETKASDKVDLAFATFQSWKKEPLAKRAELLKNIGMTLREQKEQAAKLMALEMGKPVVEGRAEIDKCAAACDYFSENLENFLKPQDIKSGYHKSQIVKDPLGPIFAVMPWNFPFWQVIRFAVPSLGIGNTVVLKHADLVAGCGELIEEIFTKASGGLPLLQNAQVDHELAAILIAKPHIRGVTFTGSTRGLG